MQLSKTEAKILNCICEDSQRYFKQEGIANWTKIIKHALEKLGKKMGYRVYPSGRGRRREWLYDLCWSKEDKGKGGWRKFRGLGLIAEIEWKKGKDKNRSDSILEDFQKLTIGNAAHRLMVIGYNDKKDSKYNENWLSEVIKMCRKSCRHSGKNFRCFIVALPERKKENIKRFIINKGKTHRA